MPVLTIWNASPHYTDFRSLKHVRVRNIYDEGHRRSFDSIVAEIEEQNTRRESIVLFSGGTDICTNLYGQHTRERTGQPDIARDVWENFVADVCLAHDIPMFGICRGHQFLAVKHGATLIQDINTELEILVGGSHPIRVVDERVDQLWADSPFGPYTTNSLHHQAVDGLDLSTTEILAVDARNERIVEMALWYNAKGTISGGSVQGHPEHHSWLDPLLFVLDAFHADRV